MSRISEYMEQVDNMLNNTTDPFAKKYPNIFRTLIEMVANDNWLTTGEAILSKEQMDDVYVRAKNQSGDKTWALVGTFNICMN